MKTTDPSRIHAGLVEMRSAFDRAFAAPVSEVEPAEPLIQLRAGDTPLAVRVSATQGIVRCPKIVPIPSRIPELSGLVAIRGAVVPVFDLAALLGLPSAAGRPPWLILAACDGLIGLAFEAFEGQQSPEWVSGQEGAPVAAGPAGSGERAATQLVRSGGQIRQVVDVPALLESIRTRSQLRQRKETE